MKILINTIVFVLFFQSTAFCVEISLQEVLDQARVYWNARLGQSQIEAETSSKLARSAYLPNVDGSYNIDKQYLVTPGQDWQGSVSAQVNQQLLDVSDLMTIGARNLDAIAQACQTEADQIEISQNVISLFFRVLGNMDEDRLQTKRAARITRAVNLLRETTKLRLSSQADLYLAESQVYQIEIQRAQIAADKTASLNALRTQLGISPKDPLLLQNKFIESNADLANWDQWSENIPSVLVLKGRILAVSKDINATQWELFPNIDATILYNDPINGLPGDSDSLSILGTVRVPLFDRMSRQIRAKRFKRLLPIFENLYQTKKNEVTNTIAALIIQKKADLIALEKATKQMEISEKAYNGAWTLLSLGKNDFFNIQNAQDVAINAERQWLQIRRRLDATNANLELLSNAVKNVKTKQFVCKDIMNP